MNGASNQTGKLFLCKQSNEEIYVEGVESLSQHHINGIRFLYLQFKKKYPGVILDDSSELVCLVFVYFLKAIQHILKKPILIVASHDHLPLWIENLNQSGVEFTQNVLARKNVFVTSTITTNSIAKEWNIVVIHDNDASKEIIQTDFKSEFKIWMTSVDLKVNLQTLQLIYTWLTKETMDIKQFIPGNNAFDRIKKSMLLDVFLEDIYFRSSYSSIPMEKEFKSEIATVKNKTIESRGNKDVTGTKIKKSKRRLNDEDLSEITNEKPDNKKQDIKNKEIIINTEDFAKDMPMKNEIKDSKIECTDSPTLLIDNSILNAQRESLSNINCNQTAESQDEIVMDSQSICSFGHAIQDIVENENMQNESTTTKLELESDSLNNINEPEESDCPIKKINTDKPTQSIDSKLLECEEMALKKFKGSFLDSIF